MDESSGAAGDDSENSAQPKMDLRPSVIGNNYYYYYHCTTSLYVTRKMWPSATDVVWSVCVSVCWSEPSARHVAAAVTAPVHMAAWSV